MNNNNCYYFINFLELLEIKKYKQKDKRNQIHYYYQENISHNRECFLYNHIKCIILDNGKKIMEIFLKLLAIDGEYVF